MNDITWIRQVKKDIPNFLKRMRDEHRPGFFRYSFSGDLLDETVHWGLGNTVFAVKIYYTLGLLNQLSHTKREEMAEFIRSFRHSDGTIYDPVIAKRARWLDKLSALKHKNFNNFSHAETIRAETRQAMSALILLGERDFSYPEHLPRSPKEIRAYLSQLDWTKPWSAGSHFSHLLFFLSHCDKKPHNECIDAAVDWIATKQRSDGFWYDGLPSIQQKINGAMKVITGFQAANRLHIKKAKQLIDLALFSQSDQHACDNFNVIYVITKANDALGHKYRFDEIRTFARNRLCIYQTHYWSEYGGFSFFQDRANDRYYNARISRGLPEPDIHGTVLFLWGLSMIGHILDWNDIDFNEFIT